MSDDETGPAPTEVQHAPAAENHATEKPLRLAQVTVENFRNVRQPQSADLVADLTVLVGANGSGKTTMLEALRCLLDPGSIGGHESTVIKGRFVADNGCQEWVRARFDGAKWQRESLTYIDPDLGKPLEKATIADLKPFLGTNSNGPKGRLVADAYDRIATKPVAALSESWTLLTQELAGRLPRLIWFDAESATDPHAEIEKLAQREFQLLAQQEQYAGLTHQLGELFKQDIAPTMEKISDTVQRRCGEVVSQVQAAGSIDFAKIKPTVDVRATTSDGELSATELSLGQRRRMGLAIHEALTQVLRTDAEPGWDLIIYDEPDTHLDFVAQRKLADVLREQAGMRTTQVVAATHAPRLIDQVPPHALVHLRSEAGHALAENLAGLVDCDDETARNLLHELDHSLGNSALLAERCIVITEGPSDTAALQELYRRRYSLTPRNDGVVIVEGNGGDGAIGFARHIIQRWRRNVLLVLDQDQDTQRAFQALHAEHSDRFDSYTIGERELEDSFSNECWATALTDAFTLGGPWSADEIADLRATARKKKQGFSKAMAKALRDRTIQASKIDVARAIAQQVPIDELAEELHELLDGIQGHDRD